MDERHFAKEVPRQKRLEKTGFDIIDILGDLHFPLEDHIKAVLDFVLPTKHSARRVRTDLAVGDQLFNFVWPDPRKGSRDDPGGCSACGHGM